MYISRIYNVYHKDIIIKKGTEQAHLFWSRHIPGILVRSAYDWNITGIYLIYTMHIQKSFWYSSYIPRIFMEYTIWYILCIYLNIPSLYIVYAQYIHCIYLVYIEYIVGIYNYMLSIYIVYTCIICVYTPPGGWCCGGGQGPIPPAPPATTSESPGRVITFILLEQGIECHTRNIPGIYQVYSRYIPNACPWTSCWILLQGWPRGYL